MPSSTQLRARAFQDRTHRAFVDFLTSTDDTAPAWRLASAGFYALRFVDRWFRAAGPVVPRLPEKEITSIRAAIANAPTGALREGLTNLLAAAVESWGMVSHRVMVAVLAYGQMLQQAEEFPLAVDAYNTFIAYAGIGEQELLPDSFCRLGFCLRLSSQFEAAPIAYGIACALAHDTQDLRLEIHSRFGMATVMIRRGALADAEVLLHRIEHDLSALPVGQPEPLLSDLRAQARHEMGTVFHHRRKYERAALLYGDALALYQDPVRRERVLLDIALNFVGLDARGAARDALLINYVTGTVPHVRRVTAINLLQLAGIDGQEVAFESYRREIAAMSSAPFELAHFQLYVAEGSYRFGRRRRAMAACRKAFATAAMHGIEDVRARAEVLERRLHEGAAPTATPSACAVPTRLEGLARTILQLRQVAETALR